MRMIKFRAWDRIDKRMRYENDVNGIKEFPSLLAVGFHGLPISIDEDSFKVEEIVGWNRDHNLYIMQFTGLCDKNGVEIYEGDVVYAQEYGNWPLVVVWEDEFTGFYCRDYKGGNSDDDLNIKAAVNGRVVGNIYENPALAKGATE